MSDKKCFNFCFWAKCLVAIPALPLIGYIASLPFAESHLRWLVATIAVLLAVYGAITIERIAALQKIIRGGSDGASRDNARL